jgi:hypothetical protein
MESPEISVYGEAKGEYTHQLCVFLLPTLETYFLNLLQQAKEQAPTPDLTILKFQEFLESIPDWNQDKVQRETEKIQKDCSCDYLEELLTAVFIAHTKVLSAIRLTTKQKKLQITIPKLEHFLHRLLSDCARSLWTNSFLFESSCLKEKNSIMIQKDLRHVAKLLQEAILQAIRGLLPVKSILREYLHDDDEDAPEKEEKEDKEEKEEKADASPPEAAETSQSASESVPISGLSSESEIPAADTAATATTTTDEETPAPPSTPVPEDVAQTQQAQQAQQSAVAAGVEQKTDQPPMIFIDTKPSVSFSNHHVFFDSDNLDANEIADIPFTEAEEDEDSEHINITEETLPMEADEILA